ncbi:uncharacterized protein LOC133402846 isoform X1 [Phycodurus eques]|uniref:uncharacterized protein LOC133402846 isoform X1 n=1 Tax=Phycodurus eques TaxID=693459 RepID=UPI002ACEDD71|nr:uncharacterized protein LOC133402846 isoform X1 [Phycodurus eques]
MIVEKTPAKLETSTGETIAGPTVSLNDLQVLNKSDDHEMKTLKTPDVPAELIVSFTSEQSVTEKSPVSPVPTKSFSAKRRRATDCPELSPLTKKQQRKLLQKHSKSKKEASKPSFETPGLQKLKKPSEDDRLSSQAEEKTGASNIDWEKLRRWVMKGQNVTTITVESVNAEKTNPEKRTLPGANVIDLEAPLRQKSERWNLKPVISECGRVLVPHGLRDLPSFKSFKETANVEQFPSPTIAPDAAEIEEQPSVFPELAACGMEVMESKTGSPDQSTVQDSEDGDDPVQPEGVHEHTGPTYHDQCTTKHEPTCILTRRKTSKHHLDLNENSKDLTAETGPSLKKNRFDLDVIMIPTDTAVAIEQDSTVQSVNPEETTNTVEQSRVDDPQKREGLLETQGDKGQIISRPPSIYPKWNRIKTLRKHLDISREHFKKTWWMHFQPPSRASQTLKECARVYSLRKKTPISNSSTDALNLLADLALGATSEQVPSQSDQEVERQSQSGLRKNDEPKDVTSAGEVSVLYTLLGQPVTRVTSSPSPLVEGTALVSLLCKEHGYSLPLSAAIPSGLPGTPFQVSPLSGSTGLLHRQHGIQTPQNSDDLEDTNCVPSDHLGKWMNLFKRYRSFVSKGESVQVTRQWKEKYDFNRDSRFSSDPKDRTVIRALHGPWDLSSQDTSEDMQLIVNMWISFFYSRSTARFVDMGSDVVNPHSNECKHSEAEITTRAQSELGEDQFALPPGVEDTSKRSVSNASDLSGTSSLDRESEILDLSLENPNRVQFLSSDRQVNRTEAFNSPGSLDLGSNLTNPHSEITALAQSKPKVDAFTSPVDVEDTSEHSVSNTSDLRGTSSLDRESEILDLSLGNPNRVAVPPSDPQRNGTKASDSPSSPIGLKEAPAFQSDQTTILSAETLNKSSSKCCWTLSQDAGCLQHTEAPSGKEDVNYVQGELEMVSVQTEDRSSIVGMDRVLHNSNRDKTDLKGGSENADPTERIGLFKCGRFSSFPERGLYKEASDATPPVLQIEYKESDQFCNRKLSAREQPEADQAENLKFTQHSCRGHNHSVKGSDGKDNCNSAFTAEDGDLSDQPVFIVFDSDDSELEDHSAEPNRRDYFEKQLLETDVELQSRMVCQNKAITDHAVSGYTCVSVSEVGITHNASTSEILSLVTRKMEGITSQTMSSVERESLNKARGTFSFGVGTGGDEKVATMAPNHQQPHLIQCETVKHSGSDLQLDENRRDKVQEIPCGVIIPLKSFSGKNTTPTDLQGQVEVVVRNHTGTPSPRSIPKLSLCRVSVLKVGETSQPHIVAGTDGTIPVTGDETVCTIAQHQQNHLIQCATVKHLDSDVGLIEEGRDKVEEIHCEVKIPLRGFSSKNTTPTGPMNQVEGTVGNHTETEFVIATTSPKSVIELSPRRVSVLKVGETRQPDNAGDTDGTISVEGDEKVTAIAQTHQQSHLIRCETVKISGTNVELIEEGEDKKVEESNCRVIIPFRGFFIGTGSPKSIRKLSPCRVSVLRVSDTSQPDAAGGSGVTLSVERGEKVATIPRNHQQSHLIECETIKDLDSDVELTEEGQDKKVKDIHCIVPLKGFSRENTTPTEPQSLVEEAVWNQREKDFFIRTGSPKSILELSPCRASVLKVSGTSQPDIAEGRSDNIAVPTTLDDKPKSVGSANPCNEVCSDVPHPRILQKIDTNSSPTDKWSQIESTNITPTLGQPSNLNDTKDKNAKLAQSASTSQSLRFEPSDRLVVISQLKSKPEQYCLDIPTYRMKLWKTKCRFYILVTSGDAFFEETKACLEAAGHTAVQPDQFFLYEEHLPLLIIVKNEDISAHLSQVPHLLELKKLPDVLFAGIDEPHDLVNLTHQELFLSGGFVMFDRSSLESLSLDEVKRFLEVVQELNKTGKWKWLLHYRDSRRFKENARFSAEAEEKKRFFSWSQETGLCSVLPYHECDAKSRDQPDYLACLVHLQDQNIAARFPVFVTDIRTVNEFEKNGILTTTVNSFLMHFST